MFIYPPTEGNIAFFARVLQHGEVVAIPTETVYGLEALALNPEACQRIFTIKGRPLLDPLIVHVPRFEWIDDLAIVPPELDLLAKTFWPGPLTVILPKKARVPDIVTAGRPTVAIRIPRHPVAQALLKAVGQPLAAPSANPFGYISPSKAGHVAASFGERVPWVVDGGACEIGLESTILDMSVPASPAVLRPGAIGADEIAQVLGRPVELRRSVLEESETAVAPGTYARHYSPRTCLRLFEENALPTYRPGEAIIRLKRPLQTAADTFWFSENGDLAEVARALFDLLRAIDERGYDRVHCEMPRTDGSGLAVAIRDRLGRAAAR